MAKADRCLFCSIIQKEAAAPLVFEDEAALVMLDHRPLFIGHCLVLPKEHFETLTDIPAQGLGPLFAVTQRIARAIERGLQAEGTFVAMNNRISQSVAHLHVHVVPRRKKDGLKGFFWPRTKYADEAQVRATIAALQGAL